MDLFLDDGGVISDNRLRAGQWQRLVGEFFPPRLGGDAAVWARVNREVAPALYGREGWAERVRADPRYRDFERRYQLDWIRLMCEGAGVPAPADDDDAYALATEATAYVTRRVRAAQPGTVEAIRRLHADGHRLHTGSGGTSVELDGYLTALGVRALFRRTYGPDLVDVHKDGPEFYRAIFADAGVEPADAVVLDDSPAHVRYAMAVGARGVLVGGHPASVPPGALALPSLAALPDLLAGRA